MATLHRHQPAIPPQGLGVASEQLSQGSFIGGRLHAIDDAADQGIEVDDVCGLHAKAPSASVLSMHAKSLARIRRSVSENALSATLRAAARASTRASGS
jgi:hypothetical protein